MRAYMCIEHNLCCLSFKERLGFHASQCSHAECSYFPLTMWPATQYLMMFVGADIRRAQRKLASYFRNLGFIVMGCHLCQNYYTCIVC